MVPRLLRYLARRTIYLEDQANAWSIWYLSPSEIIQNHHILLTRTGPVVRINPHELHFSDPNFINEIFAGTTQRRDKFKWTPRMLISKRNRFHQGKLRNLTSYVKSQTPLLRPYLTIFTEREEVRWALTFPKQIFDGSSPSSREFLRSSWENWPNVRRLVKFSLYRQL